MASSTLPDAVNQFIDDANIAHQIVQGDENTDVPTESGPCPTFRKATKNVQAVLVNLSGTGDGQGSEMVGFIQAGTGAVPRTVQGKNQEPVSVEDFGAVDGSLSDAAPAFTKAFATGKAVLVPGKYVIASTVTVDRDDAVMIGSNPGYSQITSTVPSGYTFVMGTTAVPAKGGLVVRGIRFIRSSGTTSCLRITENLDALIEGNYFSGFSDYAIEANQSDGLIIRKNLIFGCSVKCYSEMDRLVIAENDIQAAPNHPNIEVYGGAAIAIEKNFLNWSNHEAIVLGYDSVRGDYQRCPTIRNNYIERCCQTDTGSTDRPFIHVGKPVDQTGAAYGGPDVVLWASVTNNYINADAGNANLANVIPALFERVTEVFWDCNRPINFTKGGAGNGIQPRIKYPMKNFRAGNHNTKYVDISTGGTGAYQQFSYPALSPYREMTVFLGTVIVPTDAGGSGAYNFTNVDTGANPLDTGRMIILCTPQNDCRVFTSNYAVSSGTSIDGTDQISWRVNVAGGPVSSSVGVVVSALVLVP
ncbi:hypothetical protein ACDA63_07090 [Uliginosibacterium sp. sgz301328]|uniref:hypothetical protein n=1 Tax=Uliginosibacterium sp. sgz301328 TaxID=3243764 RepID=UPI00359DFE79